MRATLIALALGAAALSGCGIKGPLYLPEPPPPRPAADQAAQPPAPGADDNKPHLSESPIR